MKRSAHVALLLMGTAAVGGTAYSLMPSENCSPDRTAIAGPNGTTGPNDTKTGCVRRSSSSSSGGSGYHSWGSRTSFFSSDSASSASSGSTSSHASGNGGSSVSRGGFGSFAHSFASHFSGGG